MRETARIFAWGYTSPLGLFSYAAFYVQMATGILLGFLVGRRHWVERLPALREPIRRAWLAALGVALLAGALSLAFAFGGAEHRAGREQCLRRRWRAPSAGRR